VLKTLGEDTNLGIYTDKSLRTDDVVNFPEIAIPLLFREWGEHVERIADGILWDCYIGEGKVAVWKPTPIATEYTTAPSLCRALAAPSTRY
jgi:hypothetical protein